jgi:MSHA pilin protein MshD
MFIVIVSVALAGIMQVMNTASKNSADPLLRKQALAVAYSLLEEVELQDFTSAAGATLAVTASNRTNSYHIVSDYNGFSMPAGITSVNGVAVTGLEKYSASVAVVPQASTWNGIAAGSAVQITVTVNAPLVGAVTATGYRTAY